MGSIDEQIVADLKKVGDANVLREWIPTEVCQKILHRMAEIRASNLEALAHVAPNDTQEIIRLQTEAKIPVMFEDILIGILEEGVKAESRMRSPTPQNSDW